MLALQDLVRTQIASEPGTKRTARGGEILRLAALAQADYPYRIVSGCGSREALADPCVVVLFLGRGLHQFVINPGRNVVILADLAAGKLDFESLRIFVVPDLGNIN